MARQMTFATLWPSRSSVVSLARLGFVPDVWARYIIASLVAVTIALLLHHIFYLIHFKIARRTSSLFDDSLLHRSEGPTKVLLPLLAAMSVLRESSVPGEFIGDFSHVLSLTIIGCTGWLFIELSNIFHDIAVKRYAVTLADNYFARRMLTQIAVLRRVLVAVIVVLTVAFMLMTFEPVRQFGETVAASAGLAGIVAGLAAKSTISGLVAGIQVAITQPIRLDDMVIVEGQGGHIEEITTTFVVVRIWDKRRLIVPLTYFIEKPFENWTRRSSDIMGTVFLYVDYTVPVEEIRQELRRLLHSSDLWDSKVCGLQVTNSTDRSMELRCVMSSADSGMNFDLRCHVRESLIAYIQKNYPESLPRVRTELGQVGSAREQANEPLLRHAADGSEARAA
jgi:small-conductance mechanosensitive channel